MALGACVPDTATTSIQPGRYSNYRDLLFTLGQKAKFPADTPQNVKDRYAGCAADFVIANTAPIDMPKLDAYARGQQALAVGEMRRLDAALEARVGGPLTEGGLERLAAVCPDDVADFQRYPPHN